jgi:hypothetical protein
VRKPLLITILIVAALAAITWLFSSRSGKKNLAPWQLVPPQALAVIETQKPQILQQLNADSSNLVNLLTGNDTTNNASEPWLFSIQSLGYKTGIVALLRETSSSTPLNLAKKFPNTTVNERTYEGVQINDISQNNQPWMSIAQARGVWLVSHHSILIEEILRNLRSENKLTFRNQHSRIFQLSNVKEDDGNLYINWPAFREITSKNQNIDPILVRSSLDQRRKYSTSQRLRYRLTRKYQHPLALQNTETSRLRASQSTARSLSLFRALRHQQSNTMAQ